ncbi:MAG: conjugal transfer protein TraF [Thermoanaerobaculia bacterium]
MKHFRRLPFVWALLLAGAAGAQTPSPGAKSIGMGGTFVAAGSDAASLWGNPAGIAQCTLGCAVLFGGAIATDENRFANTLHDDFANADLTHLSAGQLTRLEDELTSFQTPGTGTIGSGSAGLAYAIQGFGIGIGGTVYTGVYPTIDLIGIAGSMVPSLDSRVTLRGLETRELRTGYSKSFSGITVGGDLRYIQGRTYSVSETLTQAAESPVNLSRDALKKNEVKTSRVAFDLGALYQPVPKLRLGIVGLNLNEPKFATFDGPDAVLPRTIRVGAAFAPLSWDGVVISADADLNKQKTLIPGLSSRRIAAGAQIYFLRVGAYRDLEAVDTHWAYTGGFQLSGHFLSLGVAGVYSTGKRDLGASAEVKIKL